MEKEFVTFKQAVELKNLGFDYPCFGDFFKVENNGQIIFDTDYNRNRIITDNVDLDIIKILAPLHQQAFKFFRDDLKIIGEIFSQIRPDDSVKWGFKVGQTTDGVFDGFNTYEEAESVCLDKLIEHCKNNGK